MAFDGVDHVVLPTSHLDDLLSLYVGVMGFACAVDDIAPDPAVALLLGLSGPPSRLCRLEKPGSEGGSIVLAEVAGLDPLGDPGAPRRAGPYALDFYARDAEDLAGRLEAAGWSFTSPAVHYDLPGTDIPVREQMLVQHRSGLLHAIVQHRPRGTRSVLGADEAQECSEVVAIVCLTPHLDRARVFATEVLGGREYFAGAFAGPAVEQMLTMEAGEQLDALLYRGPRSRNARLEFAWRLGSDPEPEPEAAPERVVVGLEVDDLDRLARVLAVGEHGDLGPEVAADLFGNRRRGRVLRSSYATTFALLADVRR